MKIMSASLSNYTVGGDCHLIVARKVRDGLTLTRARRASLKELTAQAGGRNVHLTCEYLDLLSGEVELPPVSDIKSLNVLTKNKLGDNVRKDVNYTFIRQEPVEAMPQAQSQSSVMRQFTVFGVPDDFLPSVVPARLQTKTSVITLDPFSMIAISRRVDPEALVCHAFADEDRLILTFSIGDKLVYSRVTAVPEPAGSAEELTNFYYDTINLTYLYVRQSRQVPVSVVLMTGLLDAEDSLKESISALTGIRVTDINYASIIKNCSEAQFHEYLLAIGAALVTEEVNFMSIGFQEDLFYKDVLAKLNIGLAVVLIGVMLVGGKYFIDYVSKRNELTQRATDVNGKIAALNEVIGSPTQESGLFYIDNYIDLLRKREATPLVLLAPTQDVLNRDKYRAVNFTDQPINRLQVSRAAEFEKYAASYIYETEYVAYMEEFGTDKGLMIDSLSVLSIPAKTYDMSTGVQE